MNNFAQLMNERTNQLITGINNISDMTRRALCFEQARDQLIVNAAGLYKQAFNRPRDKSVLMRAVAVRNAFNQLHEHCDYAHPTRLVEDASVKGGVRNEEPRDRLAHSINQAIDLLTDIDYAEDVDDAEIDAELGLDVDFEDLEEATNARLPNDAWEKEYNAALRPKLEGFLDGCTYPHEDVMPSEFDQELARELYIKALKRVKGKIAQDILWNRRKFAQARPGSQWRADRRTEILLAAEDLKVIENMINHA